MKPNFKRKVLKNGLTLLFEPRSLPVVSVVFAVRCGAINEAVSEKGISHFIEHLLYKGTPKRNAQQIASEIERNGGELNGFTGEDVTGFYCKMPSEHLDIALDVLSDMIKNPKFDANELEKERKVIFEEINLYKDNPLYYVHNEYQKYLYKGTLALPIIGTHKSMNSINKEKILKRFKEVYQPNNMIFCVVGNTNFNKLIKFCKENFGNEKGKIKKYKNKEINKIKVEKRKAIDQANLVFAYHVPLAFNEKNYAARILSVLMAGGMSSRLFSEIREKRNLAYAVKGHSDISKNYAHSVIYVGTTKENVNLVKKIILQEFKKVAKSLTLKELNEVKKQIIGNHKLAMEDSQTQMSNLLEYELHGNASDFYDYEKNIKQVKLKDVKKLAEKAFKKYSFFALVPG